MKSWNSVLKKEPKQGDRFNLYTTAGARPYEVTGVAAAGIYMREINPWPKPFPPGHGHVFFSWERLMKKDLEPIGNEKHDRSDDNQDLG